MTTLIVVFALGGLAGVFLTCLRTVSRRSADDPYEAMMRDWLRKP